jgi:DNA-binding response OmpR family regulator
MSQLSGMRILVVEDEPIIAMTLEDSLIELGAEPIVAGTLEQARTALAGAEPIDAAVLDVNVHGEPSYEIARELSARGTRFVFATGYGDMVIPLDLAHIQTITKPYDMALLTQSLAR